MIVSAELKKGLPSGSLSFSLALSLLLGLCLGGFASLAHEGSAHAERRPPFGTDAGLLEARVREDVERKVNPIIEQMAPGQAELGYVDVRVNRPTALATGTTPGFEDLGPGADFVAERIELSLQMDSKLPAPFRKDLKSLITARLDPLGVPVDIKERVFAFPTPRPQPPAPREPLPYYPQQPPTPQATPAATPLPPATPSPQPPSPTSDKRDRAVAPWPAWLGALAVLVVLLLAAAVGLLTALLITRRREGARASEPATPLPLRPGTAGEAPATPSGPDRWPEVRRALTEDRVLARRVMSELLREGQHDKVARAVELVGPTVVEDLRTDPVYAEGLHEAANRLTASVAPTASELRTLGDELHRRLLKHRMMGAEDPVAQAFAFLGGLPATRFAAVLRGEHPSAQATALRYAPSHLRAEFMTSATPEERASLALALADGKGTSKDYLFDVAATLRTRAVQQSHVGSADTDDVELLVEMLEDASMEEQAKLMETIGRHEPGKVERLRAVLITDERFARLSDEVLAAAALGVPHETLLAFLRAAPKDIVARVLSVLPGAVVASLREELSLDVPVRAETTADARRALHRAVRRVARERGWGTVAGAPTGPRKVVAL